MYGNTNMYKRALLRLEDEVEGSQKYNDDLWDSNSQILSERNDALAALERAEEKIRDCKAEYEFISQAYYQCIKDNAEVGALNVDLQEELKAYRVIENKTGKSPEEIIDLVSNLSGVVDAIRSKSPKCKCSSGE